MKIVVLDGYTENPGDLSWGDMEALGELTVYDRTSLTDMQEVIDRIGDAEAVITNKHHFQKKCSMPAKISGMWECLPQDTMCRCRYCQRERHPGL